MKLTDIKQQVKRTDRYSVFINGKYTFSFSQDEIVRLGLKVGQEFSAQDLEQIKKSAVEDKAYDRVLNLIARRPRSTWEIRTYLEKKLTTPQKLSLQGQTLQNRLGVETVERTLNKLSEKGYLSDLEFARAWVRTRRLLKSTNKRKLSIELRQKRVSDEIIEQVLGEDETNDQAVLRELVERKRKRYPDKLKFMQYLSRQGYSYDDIKKVMSEITSKTD